MQSFFWELCSSSFSNWHRIVTYCIITHFFQQYIYTNHSTQQTNNNNATESNNTFTLFFARQILCIIINIDRNRPGQLLTFYNSNTIASSIRGPIHTNKKVVKNHKLFQQYIYTNHSIQQTNNNHLNQTTLLRLFYTSNIMHNN